MGVPQTLQALQSTISSMSLDEALKAVEEAKKQIDALRDQQLRAADEVSEATKKVVAAKGAPSPPPPMPTPTPQHVPASSSSSYGSKGYWDERYGDRSDERAAAVYEWYLAFGDFSALLLPELRRPDALPTLVTGCGNSTLCEDLRRAGVQNVHGTDYSAAALEAMVRRAAELGLGDIRYFEADCRDMPAVAAGTYGNVVDKGTLDAIASGGAADEDDVPAAAGSGVHSSGIGSDGGGGQAAAVPGSTDALLYMIETWRVLPVGGLFAVVTTMPPAVFRAIALDPLPGGAAASTDWRDCKKKKIRTNEGGFVYFYPLRKTANLPRDAAARVRRASGGPPGSGVESTAAAVAPPDRAAVLSGIQALLEEAKKAKEEMERAQREVAGLQAGRAAAEESLSEAEARRRGVEAAMDRSWEEVASMQGRGDGEEGEGGGGASASPPAGQRQEIGRASCRERVSSPV